MTKNKFAKKWRARWQQFSWRSNASPVESLQDEAKKTELRAKGYGFYAQRRSNPSPKLTYDEIVDQEIGFIGTPGESNPPNTALQAKGGIGELAIVSNFGGLEPLEINQDAAPLCRARDARPFGGKPLLLKWAHETLSKISAPLGPMDLMSSSKKRKRKRIGHGRSTGARPFAPLKRGANSSSLGAASA